MSYSVKTICQLTGIPRATLLAWERRHQVVKPARAQNGYRSYSESDLTTLLSVKRLVDDGRPLREAVAASRDADVAVSPDVQSPRRRALTTALLSMDQAAADAEVRQLTAHSYDSLLNDLYLPILVDIGDRWHAGTATVAQEHFASTFLRSQLIAMLHRLGGGPQGGPAALVAGYPGEHHEIGLIAVAIRLALRGWRVTYMGADLPIADLTQTMDKFQPVLVCQSVIANRPKAELLAHAQHIVDHLQPAARLAMGGPGVAALSKHSKPRLLFCANFDDLMRDLQSNAS